MTAPVSARTDTSLPIGIFDSGVSGLTVLCALRARLPDGSFLYLGDTARLPYGTKSGDTVTRYALQASRHLVARGIKLLVVACNTASAVAMPVLAKGFAPLPVIGVVEAGAEAAVRACFPKPARCSWRWPRKAGPKGRWWKRCRLVPAAAAE